MSQQDTITVEAGMASVPWRENTLELAVRSLVKQVDKVHVYLNGYGEVPGFLRGACPFLGDSLLSKIVVYRSQQGGDKGSSGKFHGASYCNGIYLSCDDDILYPPDYAARMAGKLNAYKRRVLTCVHGANLRRPVKSYYTSLRTIRFEHPLLADAVVEIAGTGTLAFDTAVFRPVVEEPSYDDPQVAVQARQQQLPIVAIARPERWLTNIDLAYNRSIHGQRAHIEDKVTRYVKAHLK